MFAFMRYELQKPILYERFQIGTSNLNIIDNGYENI